MAQLRQPPTSIRRRGRRGGRFRSSPWAGRAAGWIVGAIRAHEALRTRSFYDTGHLIARLLELRDVYRVANIKELCAVVDLGLSHMTANKYLQVARAFPRERALQHGVEKCYALVVYAKAIGRPGQAARILDADEPIRGGERGARSKEVSAAKLYAAVRALKDAARDAREPTETRAAGERAAVRAEKLLRSIGVRGANAALVRRRNGMQIAVYFPIDVGEALESALPRRSHASACGSRRRSPSSSSRSARLAGACARDSRHAPAGATNRASGDHTDGWLARCAASTPMAIRPASSTVLPRSA